MRIYIDFYQKHAIIMFGLVLNKEENMVTIKFIFGFIAFLGLVLEVNPDVPLAILLLIKASAAALLVMVLALNRLKRMHSKRNIKI